MFFYNNYCSLLIQVNISCKAYIFFYSSERRDFRIFFPLGKIYKCNRMNIDCILCFPNLCHTHVRLYVHVQTRMGSLTDWMYISDEQTINNLL